MLASSLGHSSTLILEADFFLNDNSIAHYSQEDSNHI
jgi:hypothetical protein